MRALRRAALPILLCVVASGFAAGPAESAHAGRQSCSTQLRKAILCLTNIERRRHGLSQVRMNADLSSAAVGHARDMVRRRYFAHVSPAGRDHMDRIAATHYPSAAAGSCFTAGENLLVADGRASPQFLFDAWMRSPEHREIILKRGWRDFGLGVVGDTPSGDSGGLTLVALYGVRSKRLCG
jgi:uncharacterized protein YkwD